LGEFSPAVFIPGIAYCGGSGVAGGTDVGVLCGLKNHCWSDEGVAIEFEKS
jgi:hypothetical protein